MVLQHILAKRHVEFKVKRAFLHEVRSDPSPRSVSGTNKPLHQLSHHCSNIIMAVIKRGHYITGHTPNCADKAHHPFYFVAKIVAAYFSQ